VVKSKKEVLGAFNHIPFYMKLHESVKGAHLNYKVFLHFSVECILLGVMLYLKIVANYFHYLEIRIWSDYFYCFKYCKVFHHFAVALKYVPVACNVCIIFTWP